MTYDFLTFIDSQAIREHIRKIKYEFTPAEQAVILTHSYDRTAGEKLEALEYLYSAYSEEEFGADKVGMFGDNSGMTFREKLGHYINGVKASLALKEAADGYVFIACECEEGYEYSDHDRRYFSCYADTYKYIKELKAENSSELPERRYEYRIIVMPIGAISGYWHTYDNELELVNAEPILPIDDDLPMLDISEYYVWIPLPFGKGDIVRIRHRSTWCFKQGYGVFSWQEDETDERFQRMRRIHRKRGDHTDMFYPVDSFIEEDDSTVGGTFGYDHYYILDLDCCNESELDKITYGTKYLAMAFDEDSDYTMMNLLYDYSGGYIKRKDCYIDADKYLSEQLRRR